MHAIVLLCRAGFEKECAAEVLYHAQALGVEGVVEALPNAAWVSFTPKNPSAARVLKGLRWRELVFARQLIFDAVKVCDLPAHDRLTGVLAALPEGRTFASIGVETPDTNDAKSLSSFCRKFTPYLERALAARRAEERSAGVWLKVVFVDAASAFVGYAQPDNASPWPMGIPRLRMPSAAPSRSTLKLYEAWLTLLNDAEREKFLVGGMRAVDLGAAPGGWTWQLVQKGMLVTAVDNGRMDAQLMAGGMVEHVRADGFSFRPRKAVDWMVCDMVEKPSRIAELAAMWIAEKRCARAVVNFKLPMKKRFDEWLRVQEIIEERTQKAGVRVEMRAKQLYHDREEVTAFLLRKG